MEKQGTEQVVQIALDNLVAGEGNRKVGGFDKAKLEQLAESIKAVGVQQPAVVREIKPLPGTVSTGKKVYEIVAGERRWRAAKIAGLAALSCVVRDLDDVTVLKIRTIENLQREDVHPLDEAAGFSALLEKGVYDPEHLAQEMGKSISYVYQRLKLLELIASAREMLVKGTLTAGCAILIARLHPDQQKEIVNNYFQRFGKNGPSVREMDDFIRERVMMDLSKTAFAKDDAQLIPKAGSCMTCQKRTGSQLSLFADVCKKDYCMDQKCFKSKMDALVKRRQEEIADEPHLLVSERYYVDPNDKDIPKGTLGTDSWSECKAKDEGAIRVLVVDGVGRGRLSWGKKNEHKSWREQMTPQQKAAEQKQKNELKIKRDVQRRIYDKVAEGLTGKTDLSDELLRIVVGYAWDRLMDNHKVLLAKVEGWEDVKKKGGVYGNGRNEQGKVILAKLDRAGLLQFQVKIALIDALDVNPYYGFSTSNLNKTALMMGLDPKAIEAEARKAAQTTKAPNVKAKQNPK